MRYTDIVSKGSRNPVTGNLPIFFIPLFYPLFSNLYTEWTGTVFASPGVTVPVPVFREKKSVPALAKKRGIGYTVT